MSVHIIQGDVRERLAELPADYFDCIVTSPPYFGLRDYGTVTWEGGDPGCDHSHGSFVSPSSTLRSDGRDHTGPYDGEKAVSYKMPFRDSCGKCGARRIDAQIGLEPTLDAYLETMVAVCRELRRVLKPSGVFFCNIGDSYATRIDGAVDGLKPKDLCLVPERLGIALQADGWWVRSHIIWSKKNPMPESCTDRPTSAHETIWMLTKSARYFWDIEAVKEDAVYGENRGTYAGGTARLREANICGGGLAPPDKGVKRQTTETRNLRNVWHMASHPYPGAHFATFPPELAERCIKAGCPHGGQVLDPFAGSGTTGLVADRLGRDCTLIDLNTEYAEMALNRIRDDAPLFADVFAE